jgi:hypothetical protein
VFSTSEKINVFLVMTPLVLLVSLIYALLFNLIFQPDALSPVFMVEAQIPTKEVISEKFLYAGVEEYIFRFLPFSFLPLFKKRNAMKIFWVFMLIITAYFGWLHGGIENIPIQGVLGLFLVVDYLIVYLVWQRHTPAFIAATTSHALFNIVLFILNIP